jgi:hypothetical protein
VPQDGRESVVRKVALLVEERTLGGLDAEQSRERRRVNLDHCGRDPDCADEHIGLRKLECNAECIVKLEDKLSGESTAPREAHLAQIRK